MLRLTRAAIALFLVLAATAFGQEVSLPTTKPFVPSNRWALVIGVSAYSDEIGPLKYTASEARQFADVLSSDLSFESANIRLLADGGTEAESPTSQNILASLDSLLNDKRLDKANLFVFYFSGHGVGTPTGDYLLPADTKKAQIEQMGVPVKQVVERIVKAGLKNVLFIADACRAGTKNEFGAELTVLCHQANIAVILGCSPGARSYEYPELKRGAFTHFLLKNLKNSELRDESGSLWASKLGAKVQSEVHDYTEPDHGKFAQVPALWGEQSTLDVLLATYAQPPVSDAAIKAFQSKAKSLSKQEYAVAMISYAEELFMKDRYDQCVDLLKAVDQLGELTPQSHYLLASSLSFLGRVGEAERLFNRFVDAPDSFYRDIALASSCSKQLDPKIRVQAARRILQTDPVWTDKMFAWAVVRAWGTYEEQVQAAKIFAAIPTKVVRQRAYAQACLADIEGRWADSIAAFDLALKSPGESPSEDLLFFAKVHPVVASGDKAALAALANEGIKQDAVAGFCYLLKAQEAKKQGDTNVRVTLLKQALSKPLDPQQIWLGVRIAGPYLGMLQEEFLKAAEQHPYSWRCRIVLSFVKKIRGDTSGTAEDALAADRYMDEPLNFSSTFFDLMDSFMAEAVQLGTLKSSVYRSQLDFYFLTLLGFADKFGYDPDLWGQFIQYGLFNERNAQVSQVLAKRLPVQPQKAPRGIRPLLLLVALNQGDAAATKTIGELDFEPTEGSDPGWFYAMYLVTIGKTKEASQLVAKLKPPSEELRVRAEAFKTYLLAANGSVAQAKKQLAVKSDDVVVRGLQGLAWVALGDWKRAEPLLAEQTQTRIWTYLFLQEYGLRVLDAHYRKLGRIAESRTIAHSAMVSQPGNPLFNRYSFVETPGVSQFAGQVRLNALGIDDRLELLANGAADASTYVSGTLSFTISKVGELTGTFIETESKAKHGFRGKVDGYGNVIGTGEWGGKTLRLSGKVAPAALYSTDPGLTKVGQLLQLVDPDGFRVALLGRPKL